MGQCHRKQAKERFVRTFDTGDATFSVLSSPVLAHTDLIEA